MRQKELHLSDEVLLLAADGELSSRRAKKVRAHLAQCWACRTKLVEMEDAIRKRPDYSVQQVSVAGIPWPIYLCSACQILVGFDRRRQE